MPGRNDNSKQGDAKGREIEVGTNDSVSTTAAAVVQQKSSVDVFERMAKAIEGYGRSKNKPFSASIPSNYDVVNSPVSKAAVLQLR